MDLTDVFEKSSQNSLERGKFICKQNKKPIRQIDPILPSRSFIPQKQQHLN